MGTYERDARAGSGWVAFAGIMVGLVGVLNLFYGIAAIDNSSFYAESERFVLFTDLNAWGWIHTLLGIVQIGAAFSIFNGHAYGRVIGVLTAGFNLVVVLFWITAFPFSGFAIVLIDLLVIYGLVVYGGRPQNA